MRDAASHCNAVVSTNAMTVALLVVCLGCCLDASCTLCLTVNRH